MGCPHQGRSGGLNAAITSRPLTHRGPHRSPRCGRSGMGSHGAWRQCPPAPWRAPAGASPGHRSTSALSSGSRSCEAVRRTTAGPCAEISGSRRRFWPSRYRRSKANSRALCAAPAASSCWRAPKSAIPRCSTMASPSRYAVRTGSFAAAAAIGGNRCVQSRPRRVRSLTRPFSTRRCKR